MVCESKVDPVAKYDSSRFRDTSCLFLGGLPTVSLTRVVRTRKKDESRVKSSVTRHKAETLWPTVNKRREAVFSHRRVSIWRPLRSTAFNESAWLASAITDTLSGTQLPSCGTLLFDTMTVCFLVRLSEPIKRCKNPRVRTLLWKFKKHSAFLSSSTPQHHISPIGGCSKILESSEVLT